MGFNWTNIIKVVSLITYGIQLIFLQLFIRLEPTMFGVNISQSYLYFIDEIVHYLPAIVFASTALLVILALFDSPKYVRAVSFFFLIMMLLQELVPLSFNGSYYGSQYWLVLSMMIIIAPEILLLLVAVAQKSISALAVAVSSSIAVSFYIWSFATRITFSLPPISLLTWSVFAFTVAFAVVTADNVKRIGFEFYVSFAVSVAITALISYYTASNVLIQKIVNMILQTSIGAPTPLPWFAVLYFFIFFTNIYSLMVLVKSRQSGPLLISAGSTMIFTSVYLPYNVLYIYIAFSGALLVYFGLVRQVRAHPSPEKMG